MAILAFFFTGTRNSKPYPSLSRICLARRRRILHLRICQLYCHFQSDVAGHSTLLWQNSSRWIHLSVYLLTPISHGNHAISKFRFIFLVDKDSRLSIRLGIWKINLFLKIIFIFLLFCWNFNRKKRIRKNLPSKNLRRYFQLE